MLRASRLLDSRGNPMPRAASVPARRRQRHQIEGRYDSAQSDDESHRHWRMADGLSARAANSPEVRFRLRERARYEVANNSYAAGMVQTLANDTIGTGPRLQMLLDDSGLNRRIEADHADWHREVGMPEKLRTMRGTRAVDGEPFALFDTADDLESPVKLYPRLVECDQVATPYPYPLDPMAVDGLRFDRLGRPVEYHLLRSHPGDDLRNTYGFEFDRVPASLMAHWFRKDRPHQFRGVPEITPALGLFAQLRRYTLAVLAAAETAADFAAVVYSELPPDDQDNTPITPFSSTEIERRMMVTLPSGWKMNQFEAVQPTATYESFKHEILNEIARCLSIPFNVAAGNSSNYNYASGRLDHQTYYRNIGVDQASLEAVLLDPLLDAWLDEYAMAARVELPPRRPHRWLWPGTEHVDPFKEAKATQIQLQSYTTTFTDECHRDGVDPRTRVRTIAADVAMFAEYGLPNPYAPPPAATGTQPPPVPDDGTGDTGDENDGEDQGDGEDDPAAAAAAAAASNGHRAHPAFAHRNGHLRP